MAEFSEIGSFSVTQLKPLTYTGPHFQGTTLKSSNSGALKQAILTNMTHVKILARN